MNEDASSTGIVVTVDSPTAPVKGGSGILSAIPAASQLELRFDNVNAYVSKLVGGQQPSLASRATSILQGKPAASPSEAPTDAKEERQILHDISGVMRPGEVFAMMGPSGSGKTSLMSVISGRAPRAVRTQGKVSVNGQPFNKAMKRRVGFVLQDDLLYESLTVTETLSYAAQLRLPESMPGACKAARVDAVIAALGLGKCADTIIGGFFRRGVSGGERKRVSIGHELLIDPAIILLDEPTSGLDSTSALHLITTLHKLAAGGRAVGTTIHQPSSRLYQQLDVLMLLADGHVMYYGPADMAAAWFTQLGFPLPYGVNVADHILDLAAGEVASTAGGFAGRGSGVCGGSMELIRRRLSGEDAKLADASASLQPTGAAAPLATPAGVSGPVAVAALWRTYEAFAASGHPDGLEAGEDASWRELKLLVHDAAEAPAGRAARPERQASSGGGAGGPALTREISRAYSISRPAAGAGPLARFQAAFGMAERGGAAYTTQLRVLFERCIKVRRFDALGVQRFVQLAGVAAITGMLWWQRGRAETLQGYIDVVGLLFFELLFPSFSSLFSALFTFSTDFKMLLKERASGMYRVSAYYLARTGSDLPMDCVYPSLFMVIVYLMGGLKLTAGAFFANWAAIMLVVLAAQSLGLLLGAIFMNPKTAQTASTVIMLTFMLVSGYYVRDVPVWIGWLRYLSFTYWGFNLLLKIQFSGAAIVVCPAGTDSASLAAWQSLSQLPSTLLPDGCRQSTELQRILQLPSDPYASPGLDVGVLLAMLVALRLAVYAVLRHKTKPT